MPPIHATHEGYGSPQWPSGPYTRARTRTTSLRENIASLRKHTVESPVSGLPDYLIPSVSGGGYASSSDDSSLSSNSYSKRSISSDGNPALLKPHNRHFHDSPVPLHAHLASSGLAMPGIETGYEYPGYGRQHLTRHPSLCGASRKPSLMDLDSGRRIPEILEPSRALPHPWAGAKREYEGHSTLPSRKYSRSQTRSSDGMPAASLPLPPQQLPAAPGLVSNLSNFPNPEPNKAKFVEGLVGAAVVAVEVVWKYPSADGSSATLSSPDPANVLPLRHFIKEVLRRSRSTCSTLQTALYYIHKSRDAIRDRVRTSQDAKLELARIRQAGHYNVNALPSPPWDGDLRGDRGSPAHINALLEATRDPIVCGRRMFLAALICASKFLQDRTYSNRAWAKISSLPVQEINVNEKVFLELLDYNLFVNADLFKNWTKRLQELADKQDRSVRLPSAASHPDLLTLPKPTLPLPSRDGVIRSHSEYLPAPEATELPRPALPSWTNSHYPLTPVTPRGLSTSPEHYRSTPSHLPTLHRSMTEPRFDAALSIDRKLPSLGSMRLPPPSLSLKIPYAPPSPSPLSSSRFDANEMGQEEGAEDEEDALPPLHGMLRPSLAQRGIPSRTMSLDGLPRPSLSSQSCARYLSSTAGMEGNHGWPSDDLVS